MKTYINEKMGKQWSVNITDDNVVETIIGKIGEKGILSTRGCATRDDAEKKQAQLIAEKVKAGYVEAPAPEAATETTPQTEIPNKTE